MAVNGPVKGPGGPAPLTPEIGVRRPSTPVVPQRNVALARPQAPGGPPVRANSLPPGNRPQGAVLPQRRASLPSTGATPWAAHAALPNGMPQGLGLQHGEGEDPMKALEQHLESLNKTAEEGLAKHIEATNKATDGVKDAVSTPSA